MKYSILLAAVVPLATAFPRAIFEETRPEILARAREILEKRQSGAGAATAIFEPANTFNAKAQYIDISASSGHQYKAPGSGDLRGPCPGLNAFANHGFLPHNGYASIQQFVQATEQVVGMGPQLALFLSVYGAEIDGSGLGWSIGGTPSASVGAGNGISGSHNKYESDASPTRPDLYQAGNDYQTQVGQFKQLLSACPSSITMECLTSFRSQRFDTQVASNKYFFNGPFTGVAVQPAAYTFIFRFMANHSSEYPTGYLSHDVLQTWFGISGSNGNYQANQGQEQIPANWYRRAIEYPYELEYYVADVINAALLHNKFINIGGNTGKTNSFTGVDITSLTGGVYNAQTLLQGNNAACLAFQFAANAKPDIALGALNSLTSALGSITGALSCPQLQKIDNSQLQQFPGYTRSPAA